MKLKGIIFDFNGVLLWDSHWHEAAWKEISQVLRGTPFSSEEIMAHVHGKPNRYVLERLLGRSMTPEEVKEFSAQKESLYQHLCITNGAEFRLSPGAVELFEWASRRGISYTIATASDEGNLLFFVRHLKLDRWFDLSKIVYDNGSFTGKREMYIKAAQNLGLFPQECLVVEDAPSGIEGAYQAGIGEILALGPRERRNDLKNLKGVSGVILSLEQFPRERFLHERYIPLVIEEFVGVLDFN